jgi:superfamily II DNA or RNA helicase
MRRKQQLLTVEQFDPFQNVRDFPVVSRKIIRRVKDLDEKEELEPYFRAILQDSNSTPHGPAEIVDILTHKVSVAKKTGLAAFILKGKSFPTVRPHHVSHQIYRLEKIASLEYAIFACSGDVLDQAKEEFISTATRLGCYFSIFDAADIGRLLVAYGFLCPRDGRRIAAGRCKCGYSPAKRVLNLLQQDALKSLKEGHNRGERAGLVILPPGSGKTRIAAEDAKRHGAKRILYVGHVHEILDVAQSEFEAVFGKKHVSRHSSISVLRGDARVTIATIQLLDRRQDEFRLRNFDYLVIDEFHHAAASSYRRLLENIQPAFTLGLTATPFRSDRQDILELCGQNVVAYFELRTAIETGILSPYHYFGCFDDIDYSKVRYQHGHYDIRDLERALVIPERDAAILTTWKKHSEGRPTLAFCCSHVHAERFVKSCKKNNISAATYLSSTPLKERAKLLDKLANGEITILAVVDVMNEGADIPYVECLLFLRPTESKRIFYQQLGRGLRRYAGKTHCTIIDFIGNFKNAYLVVEYQGLLPIEDLGSPEFRTVSKRKELLNLPLGCQVNFDDRVIDIFAQQTLNPQHATRQNIGRILLYQYDRLAKQLGRPITRKDVDRNLLLDSRLYEQVFGSWRKFEAIALGKDE